MHNARLCLSSSFFILARQSQTIVRSANVHIRITCIYYSICVQYVVYCTTQQAMRKSFHIPYILVSVCMRLRQTRQTYPPETYGNNILYNIHRALGSRGIVLKRLCLRLCVLICFVPTNVQARASVYNSHRKYALLLSPMRSIPSCMDAWRIGYCGAVLSFSVLCQRACLVLRIPRCGPV